MIIKSCKSKAGTARPAALIHLVGANELYPMLLSWQSSSLAFRRYAGIIDQKSSIFVNLRRPDTENFGLGFQSGPRRKSTSGAGPPDPCSIRWAPPHTGEILGLIILQANALVDVKEGIYL